MWFDLSKFKAVDLIDKKVVWEKRENIATSIFKEDYQTLKCVSKIVWTVEKVNWEIIKIHCLSPNWVISIVTLNPDEILDII